jgi:hypothetical protein
VKTSGLKIYNIWQEVEVVELFFPVKIRPLLEFPKGGSLQVDSSFS